MHFGYNPLVICNLYKFISCTNSSPILAGQHGQDVEEAQEVDTVRKVVEVDIVRQAQETVVVTM